MAETILVVDDEENITKLIAYHLTRAGYEVQTASCGEQAIKMALKERVDLIVLDVMLPDLDGFEVYRRVRSGVPTPVIFLSARDDEIDKVVGLELGADDYLTKPFSPREFLARVKAVLRRTRFLAPDGRDTIEYGDLRIDLARHEASVKGNAVPLTPIEFELLKALALNPGVAMSRELLMERVWGDRFGGDARTVDVHIKRLRGKIELDPSHPGFIHTVWGIGYRFEEGVQ